jgi:GNAT superfamily N-acetyltransferase
MGWVVQRNAAVYAEEFGWDSSYEALVARIVADYVDNRDPEAEAAWIAEVDGMPAGCVFCVRENATTARLRLLLVEPWARGLGIGSRLAEEMLRFACQAGYSQVTLWTNDVLADARRIYQRAGFTLDNESRHHSFGKEPDWPELVSLLVNGGTSPAGLLREGRSGETGRVRPGTPGRCESPRRRQVFTSM